MAFTGKTVNTTGQTLVMLLERASDGYWWNNVASEWQVAPSTANKKVSFAEQSAPLTGEYYATPTGDLGSPGKVWVHVIDDTTGYAIAVPTVVEIQSNAEVGTTTGEIADAVNTELADDFATVAADIAAVPAAVDTELSTNHGDGNWESILGPGENTVTLTVTCDGSPVQSVNVWVSSDSAGNTVIVGPVATDVNGQLSLFLTDGSTYYFWSQVSGYNPVVAFEFEANETSGNSFTLTEVTEVPGTGTSIYDLCDLVKPWTSAPDAIVKAALRYASKEFFDKTGAWVEVQTDSALSAAEDTFSLTTTYEALTRRLLRVRQGTATSPITETTSEEDLDTCRVEPDETVIFQTERAIGTLMEFKKCMTPNMDCVTFPAELISRWGYALAYGALARIFTMPQYKNQENFVTYNALFAEQIADAGHERVRARKGGVRQMGTPETFK